MPREDSEDRVRVPWGCSGCGVWEAAGLLGYDAIGCGVQWFGLDVLLSAGDVGDVPELIRTCLCMA